MDLLADILQLSGLKKRMLNQHLMEPDSSIKFPCNKSMGFHVVTQGEATIELSNKKKIYLKRGDLVLLARGLDHQLRATSAKTQTLLVSGVYQLWNEPLHPFFKELEEFYVIHSEEVESGDPLHQTLNLLSREVTSSELGSESIVQALLDVLFNLILRKIVKKNSLSQQSWSFATQNQQIAQTLELMHTDYRKEWTIDKLAKEVGLSRAGLAQKFKKSLGDTPLHYLTTLRVQKAMDLLSKTEDNIETIAESVGYKDAFGFSKVFKKYAGHSPKEFRKQSAVDAAFKI